MPSEEIGSAQVTLGLGHDSHASWWRAATHVPPRSKDYWLNWPDTARGFNLKKRISRGGSGDVGQMGGPENPMIPGDPVKVLGQWPDPGLDPLGWVIGAVD